MKRCCFLILLLLPAALSSRTIWRDRNIYSSGTDLNIGDIVVVDIKDISQMKFNITFNNDNSYNIVSNPDTNITGFLPKVSSDKKVKNSDKTDFTSKGNLQISIASTITARRADGKLNIRGIREYSINGKINRFLLSGIVDPELIKGRTVLSKDIAEFRLEIRGLQERGPISIERPELEEGETSSAGLTEAEKQRLIIDYINKMLRELNK